MQALVKQDLQKLSQAASYLINEAPLHGFIGLKVPRPVDLFVNLLNSVPCVP